MTEVPAEAGSPGGKPATVATSIGERLRQARQAANMSVEDAAAQLRLSPRQILALEGEQFGQLPGRTFVRGFVKNYARLLNLDPEPLLAYAGKNLDSPVLQPITEGMGIIPAEHAGAAAWQKWAILAALVAAVLAGAGYEWWQRQQTLGAASGAPSPNAAASPAGPLDTRELPTPPLPAAAAPAETPIAPAAQATAKETPPSAVAVAPKGAAIDALVTKPAPERAAPPPVLPPAKLPAAAGKIGLNFSDTTWVEIKERGGRTLLSQHYAAGQNALVSGEPPFEIVIGNASATRLSYDGKAISLAAHAHQNVARLVLP